MMELAHGRNIFEDAGQVNADQVDPEEVLARDPDVIIKCITPDSARTGTGLYAPPEKAQFLESYEDIISRPGWQDIGAVENGDIYFMTQFSHGGASKLVGTIYAAKWLYPDLLPELDPEQTDVFIQGVLELEQALEAFNEGRMQAVALSDASQTFIQQVRQVQSSGFTGGAAYLLLVATVNSGS